LQDTSIFEAGGVNHLQGLEPFEVGLGAGWDFERNTIFRIMAPARSTDGRRPVLKAQLQREVLKISPRCTNCPKITPLQDEGDRSFGGTGI